MMWNVKKSGLEKMSWFVWIENQLPIENVNQRNKSEF